MREGWIDPKDQLPDNEEMVTIFLKNKNDPDLVIPVFGMLIDNAWHQIKSFNKWEKLNSNDDVYAWEPIGDDE